MWEGSGDVSSELAYTLVPSRVQTPVLLIRLRQLRIYQKLTKMSATCLSQHQVSWTAAWKEYQDLFVNLHSLLPCQLHLRWKRESPMLLLQEIEQAQCGRQWPLNLFLVPTIANTWEERLRSNGIILICGDFMSYISSHHKKTLTSLISTIYVIIYCQKYSNSRDLFWWPH